MAAIGIRPVAWMSWLVSFAGDALGPISPLNTDLIHKRGHTEICQCINPSKLSISYLYCGAGKQPRLFYTVRRPWNMWPNSRATSLGTSGKKQSLPNGCLANQTFAPPQSVELPAHCAVKSFTGKSAAPQRQKSLYKNRGARRLSNELRNDRYW